MGQHVALAQPHGGSVQQNKVMIVEDEGLIANDIAGQLRKSGYEISGISSSGEEALALLRTSLPDLILMDIRLKGGLDGIDAALRVRSEYKLPVIFLTSHADSATLARAKQAEPFGYLVKPFRQLNLCSAIEMALYKHGSERKLMEREAWLTTVLQSTADPTIVTDLNGGIQFLNARAEQLLGCTLADAAGLPWTGAAPLFDRSSGIKIDDLVSQAMLDFSTLKLPRGLVLRSGSGSEIEVEGEISPSTLRGEVAGAVITIRDVSQRNHDEAEVRHEQKMLAIGRLAGGVAHDFNNLLTVILGHGTELARGISNPGDRVRLEAMLSAARTAGDITHQLVTLSRKQMLTTDVLNVNECVRRLLRLLESSLGLGIYLSSDLASEAGQVRMNAGLFEQVLLNLVLNARDAMPNGGKIFVSTSQADRVVSKSGRETTESFVRLRVKDSGEGIPSDVREHLFEPFFTTKPQGQGTGLGLAVVYGIVKEAGGEVAVESAPGQGAIFDILLPRVEQQTPPVSGRKAETVASTFAPKTILLAEDQAGIRGLISNFLDQQGFHVISAEDGQEAFEMAEKFEGRIDMLISDVLMPNMDGPTLSRQLCSARPDMKILFISGHPGDAIHARQNDGPVSAFMRKPFALPGLLEKIQELTA